MYIFKNAFISITRNKGRNLLIGIIIAVIACSTTVALAIRNSSKSLINSYENQYDVEATIGVNRELMKSEMKMNRTEEAPPTDEEKSERMDNMNNIFSNINTISVEDVQKYGDSDYVKEYYYSLSIGMNSDSIDAASNSNSGMDDRKNKNFSSTDFTLVGYSKLSAMEEFISGKYTITDGEVFNDMESNSCVINSELATLNDIEVGDNVIFVDPNNSENTIELTVTGIYEENNDDSSISMFTNSVNNIITTTSVINKLNASSDDLNMSVTPTFILKDKDVIEKFEDELYEKGLSEYLTVTTNLDQVQDATRTISNVETFATTFLVITLIIGGIVLFVLNMINIRERKYEIGVYRTIGMKKSKLTFQFMSELFIVAFIALLIGAGLGSTISVPVSNYLLEQEINSSMEKAENINENFGGRKDRFDSANGVVNIQAFDSIDAVVDIKVLLELFVIGIILTITSSTASMISIQKFSPLTILKERS